MKNDKNAKLSLEEILKEGCDEMVPQDVEGRMLRQLDGFRERIANRDAKRTSSPALLWRMLCGHYTSAAAVLMILVIAAAAFMEFGGHSLAFADVMKQISFFSTL